MGNDPVQDFFEVVSLALTVPTIILGMAVVAHWAPSAYLRVVRREVMSSRDWFILGVSVSFAGDCMDNLWWGVAWTLSYIENPHMGWWFYNGVYPNVFFRQLAGVYAAYCHMVAYYNERSNARVNFWLWVSTAAGLLYTCFITLFRK